MKVVLFYSRLSHRTDRARREIPLEIFTLFYDNKSELKLCGIP